MNDEDWIWNAILQRGLCGYQVAICLGAQKGEQRRRLRGDHRQWYLMVLEQRVSTKMRSIAVKLLKDEGTGSHELGNMSSKLKHIV